MNGLRIMKKCMADLQMHPETEFYKQTQNKDGLDSYCKSCRTEISRTYRAANRKRMAALQRAYRARKKATAGNEKGTGGLKEDNE